MAETRQISAKAIVFGFVAEFVVSTAAGLFLGIATTVTLMQRGVTANEMRATLEGNGILIAATVISFGSTIMGGYVAGRVAKRAEVLHAAIVGCLLVLLGLVQLFRSPTALVYSIISILGAIPFAMFGGYTAMLRRQDGAP
jgi:hypothetical protein